MSGYVVAATDVVVNLITSANAMPHDNQTSEWCSRIVQRLAGRLSFSVCMRFAHKLVPINPPTGSRREPKVILWQFRRSPAAQTVYNNSVIAADRFCCASTSHLHFPVAMKCLRVFGRSASRHVKSNVSRTGRHRSGTRSSRTTLTRGAHNQRRRRPRPTALGRDQQLIAARTDRLWNFGVQSSGGHHQHQQRLLLHDQNYSTMMTVPPPLPPSSPLHHHQLHHSTGLAFGNNTAQWGGRSNGFGGAAINGLNYVGGTSMAATAISSDDTAMRVEHQHQHQYAYGAYGDQAHFKAYKRHHTWVCALLA